MTSITILLCYYENLIKNVVITKTFIKNVVYNYNACKLTVYVNLFCLYLAIILRNNVKIRF